MSSFQRHEVFESLSGLHSSRGLAHPREDLVATEKARWGRAPLTELCSPGRGTLQAWSEKREGSYILPLLPSHSEAKTLSKMSFPSGQKKRIQKGRRDNYIEVLQAKDQQQKGGPPHLSVYKGKKKRSSTVAKKESGESWIFRQVLPKSRPVRPLKIKNGAIVLPEKTRKTGGGKGG